MHWNMCTSTSVIERERESERERWIRSEWFHILKCIQIMCHNATYNLCVIIGCYFTETFQFIELQIYIRMQKCGCTSRRYTIAFAERLIRLNVWDILFTMTNNKIGIWTNSTLLNNSASSIGISTYRIAVGLISWQNFVFVTYICGCVSLSLCLQSQNHSHLTYEILSTVNYQNQRKPQ